MNKPALKKDSSTTVIADPEVEYTMFDFLKFLFASKAEYPDIIIDWDALEKNSVDGSEITADLAKGLAEILPHKID